MLFGLNTGEKNITIQFNRYPLSLLTTCVIRMLLISQSHTIGMAECLILFCSSCTVKCLSIGTLITIHFPFAPKVKLIIFRDPQIWTHYSLITMCLYIGTPKNINFPFGTNGKLMVLGVPILKHLRVVFKVSKTLIGAPHL